MTKNINGKGQQHLNPFFGLYNTPHETIPFDKITLADYEEAMLEGIRREDEQIEKTINDPEEPTFENTLIREDEVKGRKHYYDLLFACRKCFLQHA